MTTFKAATEGTDKLGLRAVLERYANAQWLPVQSKSMRLLVADGSDAASIHPPSQNRELRSLNCYTAHLFISRRLFVSE